MRRPFPTLVLAGSLLTGALLATAAPALATAPAAHQGCPPGHALVTAESLVGPGNTPKTADNVNHDGNICTKPSPSGGTIFIENLQP